MEFRLQPVGPSHTPEDLVVYVPKLRMLFAGDLVFRGRVPFVGQADSGHWIDGARCAARPSTIDVVVPGHGPASTTARADLEMTRDYLVHLRQHDGRGRA